MNKLKLCVFAIGFGVSAVAAGCAGSNGTAPKIVPAPVIEFTSVPDSEVLGQTSRFVLHAENAAYCTVEHLPKQLNAVTGTVQPHAGSDRPCEYVDDNPGSTHGPDYSADKGSTATLVVTAYNSAGDHVSNSVTLPVYSGDGKLNCSDLYLDPARLPVYTANVIAIKSRSGAPLTSGNFYGYMGTRTGVDSTEMIVTPHFISGAEVRVADDGTSWGIPIKFPIFVQVPGPGGFFCSLIEEYYVP